MFGADLALQKATIQMEEGPPEKETQKPTAISSQSSTMAVRLEESEGSRASVSLSPQGPGTNEAESRMVQVPDIIFCEWQQIQNGVSVELGDVLACATMAHGRKYGSLIWAGRVAEPCRGHVAPRHKYHAANGGQLLPFTEAMARFMRARIQEAR